MSQVNCSITKGRLVEFVGFVESIELRRVGKESHAKKIGG